MAKILVVQEIAEDILDVQSGLQPAGHILLIATTIQDAMKLLASQIVDLIICAVHLQSGSVFDLLKFVKNDRTPERVHLRRLEFGICRTRIWTNNFPNIEEGVSKNGSHTNS